MWKKTDQRLVNFGKCDKIHNANVIKTLAKICPNQKRNFADRISHDRKSGGRCIDQGSHNLSKSRRGSVSKNVSSSQKGYQRPLINLKHLNQFIPYQHFKMEDLLRFKKVLLKGNYMHKLDLQDAYFLVPLNKKSRKYVRFLWSNNLYEFMCLCFGLGSAPRVFTELLKIPIALLPRLNIRLFI